MTPDDVFLPQSKWYADTDTHLHADERSTRQRRRRVAIDRCRLLLLDDLLVRRLAAVHQLGQHLRGEKGLLENVG